MICKNNIHCIYKRLLSFETTTAYDFHYLGFWVWDCPNEVELYSPKFRNTLGYTKAEFPDEPASWQKAILPSDLKIALSNFEKHVATKAQFPYTQKVRYRHKDGYIVEILCHGKVVTWENDLPRIMIGLHSAPDLHYLK